MIWLPICRSSLTDTGGTTSNLGLWILTSKTLIRTGTELRL